MSSEIKILYVDDEPINLMLFELSFKRYYRILKASTGLEGLKVLDENPDIRITISDMKMPGMNGIEFITTAKETYPHICYYILTGFDITEEIADALDRKLILKYFRKPFNVNDILQSIAVTCG
jgi:two-component system, response regulator, stage 0 sporulation protein F